MFTSLRSRLRSCILQLAFLDIKNWNVCFEVFTNDSKNNDKTLKLADFVAMILGWDEYVLKDGAEISAICTRTMCIAIVSISVKLNDTS